MPTAEKVFTAVPLPVTGPTLIRPTTIIRGTMSAEDIAVMRYRYHVLADCTIEEADDAIDMHRRRGDVYEFSFYEYLSLLGPSLMLTIDQLGPLDSVLVRDMVLIPDAGDVLALEGDVPQMDA